MKRLWMLGAYICCQISFVFEIAAERLEQAEMWFVSKVREMP